MSNWPAQSLQLVMFTPDTTAVQASSLYEAALGGSPDSTNTNRNPTAANPNTSVASGVVRDIAVNISIQPGRVDLIVSPGQEEGSLIPPPLVFADTEYAYELTAFAAPRLLDIVPSLNRIALVSVLISEVIEPAEATKIAAQTAGIEIFEDATDFQFQINRRKKFMDLPETSINRLMRFAVASFHQVRFEVGPGTGAIQPNFQELYAAMQHIDINSVPVARPLEKNELHIIWTNILAETLRIRSIGKLQALANE